MSSDSARLYIKRDHSQHPFRASRSDNLDKAYRFLIFDVESNHAIVLFQKPEVERFYLLAFNEGSPSLVYSDKDTVKEICSGDLAINTLAQLNIVFKNIYTHGLVLENVYDDKNYLCVDMIHSCLEQGDGPEFWTAVDACIGMGPYATTMLISGLESETPYLRFSSAKATAYLGGRGRAALPSLLTALNDDFRDVRLMAGAALCTVSNNMDGCIAGLLNLLGEEGSDASGVMLDWIRWGRWNVAPLCIAACDSDNCFVKQAGESGVKSLQNGS